MFNEKKINTDKNTKSMCYVVPVKNHTFIEIIVKMKKSKIKKL